MVGIAAARRLGEAARVRVDVLVVMTTPSNVRRVGQVVEVVSGGALSVRVTKGDQKRSKKKDGALTFPAVRQSD